MGRTDVHRYMNVAAENAPLFIEAFYDACEALQRAHPDYAIPDVALINRALSSHNVGYQIQPPDLVSQNAQRAIEVPQGPLSIDRQAQEIIQKSLKQSEQLLSESRDRQAVQEILWLLETVSTAFQGLGTGSGTVQGKYFNKIADDLRKHHKGENPRSGARLGDDLAWLLVFSHRRWNSARDRPEDRRCHSIERSAAILQSDPQLYLVFNGRTRTVEQKLTACHCYFQLLLNRELENHACHYSTRCLSQN